MKTPSVVAALASTAASVAFQIGLANGHFRSYDWITPYLWGAAIAFWVVFAILALRGSQASAHVAVPESSATQQQTANPAMNQTVNVNLPERLFPRPTTSPVPAPVRRPHQNIRCVEARSVTLHALRDTFDIAPQGFSGFPGSIACFRNDPVPGATIEQPHLRAHIVYRDEQGRELADVPNGLWLSESTPYASFNAGKKNCLLLLVKVDSGKFHRVWVESHTHEYSWMGGVSYRLRDELISATVASVDISLLRDGTCVLQVTLEAKQGDEGQLPELTVRGA